MKRLPRETLLRVDKAIGGLGDNPRSPDSKKLADASELYRIRVGDYRVLYEIDDPERRVRIARVRHRRNAYRH